MKSTAITADSPQALVAKIDLWISDNPMATLHHISYTAVQPAIYGVQYSVIIIYGIFKP